jgi:hypothetical protein
MRTHILPIKLGAASLSLATVLAFGGCKAVQPVPQCKAQSSDYAAKYTNPKLVSGDAATCKAITGEVLHVQYYRTLPDDPNPLPSIGIEPAAVGDVLGAADDRNSKDEAMPDVAHVETRKEFSVARYTDINPDDKDICSAPTFKGETAIDVAMIPPAPDNCPAEPDPIDPIKLSYEWSALKMMVTPLSNAVYFGAKLKRTEGDCVFTYDVTAVNPVVGCGTAKTKVVEENKAGMCVPKLDDMGMQVEEDDAFSGDQDPEKCNPKIQGAGLNTDLTYSCDKDTYLCLPEQNFPELAKQK